MKKLFLVLNFFLVLLSFSCNQIHDNNPSIDEQNGGGINEGMAVLEFGDSLVVMEMSASEKSFKSGDRVKAGTPVMIYLKEELENVQNEGYDIKNVADPFTVNGKAIGRGLVAEYEIPKNVSRIKIDAKIRKPEEITIKYSKNLKVYYNNRGGEIIIENEGKVKEGQLLKLEPTLKENEVVETWKINKNEYKAKLQDPMDMNYFGLTKAGFFVMKDGENTTINIDYVLRDAKQYTVQFDNTKMIAEIYSNSTPPTPVNPDDTVLEGTNLQFEAIIPAGKTVDKWSLNGKEVTESTRYVSVNSTGLYIHEVTGEVAKGSVINVDVTFKEAKKYSVNFDSTKMTASIDNRYTPPTPVNPDDTVLEGTRLQFEAILPAGKIVDKWFLNGNEAGKYKRYVSVNSARLDIHEVTGEVAEGGVINVDVTFKEAKKYTVQFDSTKMKARTYSKSTPSVPVNSGDTVLEGVRLHFNAILPAEKTVDKWSLNGNEATKYWRYVSFSSARLDIHEVTDEVAEGGGINVDVTFKAQ